MARKVRIAVLDGQQPSGLEAWRAREDQRLDDEPDHARALSGLASRYVAHELDRVTVEPKRHTPEGRRRATHATLARLGKPSFERDGLLVPMLRFAVGALRPGEGAEPRTSRFASEVDALRYWFEAMHTLRASVERSTAEGLRRTLMLGATIVSTGELRDVVPELAEAIGRAVSLVEHDDPGIVDALIAWHIELCEPWRYQRVIGSGVSVRFAMSKGEPAPPCTRLRGRDVSTSELVCEALGLEPSAHNARVMAGRVKRARAALRRHLGGIELSTEPRRLLP